MTQIQPDLNDQLLKRRIVQDIEGCRDDADCLRTAAYLMLESFIQSRAAAKWLGQEAARNLMGGTLQSTPAINSGGTELD
jgi:hypothetical protein